MAKLPVPARKLRLTAALVFVAASIMLPAAVAARDSLGLFANWGAFRDPAVPRCYAIAMADPSDLGRERQPFAAVGSWPKRGARNQVHFRLSRQARPGSAPVLTIDDQRIVLAGSGADAWSPDRRTDAVIVAAMRSARTMRIGARDQRGRAFGDVYALNGAATAMDAATLACARV